jgi:hypothetical protein
MGQMEREPVAAGPLKTTINILRFCDFDPLDFGGFRADEPFKA